MEEAHFDEHAFAGRRSNAIKRHAKTGITAENAEDSLSFADYDKMHQAKGIKGQKPSIPPWAKDDKKIAKIILVLMWRYLHGGREAMPEGTTLEDLNAPLKEKAQRYADYFLQNDHISDYQKDGARKHLESCSGKAGYAGFYAKVIWNSFRMGMDSVEAAVDSNISPVQVRNILHKSKVVGMMLFPEDSLPVDTQKQKGGRKRQVRNFMRSVNHPVIALIKSGLSVPEAARRIGCTPGGCRDILLAYEKATGLRLVRAKLGRPRKPRFVQTLTHKEQRRLWISQGLCGVDGKDPIWAGHSTADCEKHVLYYRALEQARRKRKQALRNNKAEGLTGETNV